MRKLFVIFFLLMLVGLPSDGWASGPGVGGRRVRLDNELAGPYMLRVVTSPTPPLVGNFNVEVRVEDLTGKVVENAYVTIAAQARDHEAEPLQAIATHEYAPLPTEYAAHLPVPSPGLWEITITVESTIGVGEGSFFQQIARQSSLSAWLSVGVPFAGLFLLVLLFFWLQKQANQETPSSEEG